MFIVVGGTGRVGSATARALLDEGQEVTVVTRDEDNGSELREIGARIAVADIRDSDTLRGVFRGGRRAFLLNPPADPSGDTDAEERTNVAAIIAALEGSNLEKVVAQSTYGAFEGKRCGDLTVLHEFEEKLRAQSIPAAINRGAYYMSNWAGMLESVRETGKLPSFFPADFAFPMVAPEDLGEAAAERLLSPVDDIELRHVEGPRHYTPSDVAKAIGDAFGLSVDLEIVPSEALQSTFLQFGFSEEAAASYACMTSAVIEGEGFHPENPARGTTGLREYFDSLNR